MSFWFTVKSAFFVFECIKTCQDLRLPPPFCPKRIFDFEEFVEAKKVYNYLCNVTHIVQICCILPERKHLTFPDIFKLFSLGTESKNGLKEGRWLRVKQESSTSSLKDTYDSFYALWVSAKCMCHWSLSICLPIGNQTN